MVNLVTAVDWDNLRDRCREFLEEQCWGNARCGGPSDDDINKLHEFVVEEINLGRVAIGMG